MFVWTLTLQCIGKLLSIYRICNNGRKRGLTWFRSITISEFWIYEFEYHPLSLSFAFLMYVFPLLHCSRISILGFIWIFEKKSVLFVLKMLRSENFFWKLSFKAIATTYSSWPEYSLHYFPFLFSPLSKKNFIPNHFSRYLIGIYFFPTW